MRELDANALEAARDTLWNQQEIAYGDTPDNRATFTRQASEIVASYLNALPPQQEGWRLVPVEPTNEMIGAGLAERDRPGSGHAVSLIYGAMLAAAPLPTPPAPQDQQ